MPCRDDGAWERSFIDADAQDHIDRLTRLLCDACTALGNSNDTLMHKELLDWWRSHQAIDNARREREINETKLAIEARKQDIKHLNLEIDRLEKKLK